MFHEKYLRDFLTVCETGNITAAAARLGLSQPALSRIVKMVEKEAGMPLLVREASGVYLTQAGEIYARMARTMLESYRNGLREIHDIRDSQSGQIRLGLSRISSETLLPVILEQFRTLYPHVELHLTETLIRQLNPLLRQGKLDLALTYFTDDPELEYARLLTGYGLSGSSAVFLAETAPLEARNRQLAGECPSAPEPALHPAETGTGAPVQGGPVFPGGRDPAPDHPGNGQCGTGPSAGPGQSRVHPDPRSGFPDPAPDGTVCFLPGGRPSPGPDPVPGPAEGGLSDPGHGSPQYTDPKPCNRHRFYGKIGPGNGGVFYE